MESPISKRKGVSTSTRLPALASMVLRLLMKISRTVQAWPAMSVLG